MELKTYATHFCGLGGACYGLESVGLKCVMAVDNWDVAVNFREKNLGHKAMCMDIADYVEDVSHAADVLWTSPVCQTFSVCDREVMRANKEDIRNFLFIASIEYLKKFKPKFFVFENVPGLLSHDSDGMGGGTLARIRAAFESTGYHCEWNILNAKYWGLPQDRERVFMVGSRDGEKNLIPKEPKVEPHEYTPISTIMDRGVTKLAWSSGTYKTALDKVGRSNTIIHVINEDDIFTTVTCGWGGGATRKKVAVVDRTKDGVPFLRHPSVSEGAKAQGMPDHWKFPKNNTHSWRLIGNAVPPPMARAIGEHLKKIAAGEAPPHKPRLSAKKIPNYIKETREELPPMPFLIEADA